MVRSQDFFTVVQYISQNPIGSKLVWDWVRSNWEYLVNRYVQESESHSTAKFYRKLLVLMHSDTFYDSVQYCIYFVESRFVLGTKD